MSSKWIKAVGALVVGISIATAAPLAEAKSHKAKPQVTKKHPGKSLKKHAAKPIRVHKVR